MKTLSLQILPLAAASLVALALTACGDKDDDPGEDTSEPAGDDGSDGNVDDDEEELPSDLDNDGWGDDLDCDDNDPDINPGADETCNGQDDDCDGDIDEEPVDGVTVYGDADGDAYGNEDQASVACEAGEGFALQAGDCDDQDADVFPGAEEVCNEIDDDCDGDVDEGVSDGSTWYADEDGDTFGDPDVSEVTCEPREDWVSNGDDCNDDDYFVNPIQSEKCNGKDDDCDGDTDESSAIDADTWYEDADEDGYGDPDSTEDACDQPSGYVANATDCDDANDENNPEAQEDCGDAEDNDCDGDIDEYCYETWEGYEVFEYDHSQYGSCWMLWWADGTQATKRCADCDFAFDITMTYSSTYSDNSDELCDAFETDFDYTYGYATDYAGYGPYLLLEYYGTWYPWTSSTSWDTTYGTFEYDYGYQDLVLSNGATVTQYWYGYAALYY